jgi:hypothetical protein
MAADSKNFRAEQRRSRVFFAAHNSDSDNEASVLPDETERQAFTPH